MELPAQTLVVLFRLKAGVNRDTYEQWAATTDLPIVRGLGSVDGFELLKVSNLLGTDAAPPYDYVELIGIRDLERFGTEVATSTMQKVAAEFRQFADNPLFMLTNRIS